MSWKEDVAGCLAKIEPEMVRLLDVASNPDTEALYYMRLKSVHDAVKRVFQLRQSVIEVEEQLWKQLKTLEAKESVRDNS